ncbi:MAG TPA: hypothetical protein VGQ76_14195 [Thermoanaerobaculia bacterium]|nr:hypothetical protein [Thermoanaerobaculia bacterium]
MQGLNRIADEELHEIERRQAELAERNERLQTEVRQLTALKINVPDLASRIATLSVVGTLEGSLEERQLHAGALEMELAELECRFMERCLQQLDSQRLDLQNAHRILQCAGVHPPDPEIDALPAGALPAAATRAVLQAKRRYQNFLKLAREVRQQLDARIERVTAEIAKILPEDLAPGDRQDAADLLAELEEGAWSRNPKRLERIERMTLVLEKCDLFVARLLQVERESRERLAELHRGFRQFSEEQLTGYCRQLAGRVRALLFGIPAHPRHWGLVQHQLEEAAVLFGRVDPQARRRAADELERAAEVLRRRVNSGFDRSGELVKLLSELEARGHESLPPVALRMRIVSASQRRI